MADEAYWADLRPILTDMAERIGRIERFLASSGLQSAASPGAVFDAAPASFGPPPSFSSPDQIAAASAGQSPFGPPPPGVVPDDILFLARSGKKIQAIAEYRRRAGVSLKEAKNIIDAATGGY